MMFSVCLASFMFIISSSLYGMPISGTHTVVGALLGTGLAVEKGVLNWERLAGIMLSWVISPCSAAVMAFALYLFVLKLENKMFEKRLLMIQILVGFCFMIFSEVLESLLRMQHSFWQMFLFLLLGVILCRIAFLFLLKRNPERN